MRRLLCVVLLVVGLAAGAARPAVAGKSCPSGSSFSGGRAGGVCIGDGGEIVKTIRN